MCRIINNLIGNIEIKTDVHYHHHYSGIYRNGKKMFIGSNHLRNSYNNECICYSTHAEMDVLHKVLKKCTNYPFKDPFDLSNYSIVVVRFGKDGSLRNSRPCNHCLLTMVKYRIKKIMYSTDEGKMVTSKPQEMEHLHVSSGWNAFIHPERLKK
jgi:hypothetical protein